jgi:IS30 family transposase
LSAVSDEEVRKAYDGLNRRPRKRYGWRCPWEVYHGEALHLL